MSLSKQGRGGGEAVGRRGGGTGEESVGKIRAKLTGNDRAEMALAEVAVDKPASSTLPWVLWRSGSAPWNYARFLDYAADRLILQP